MTETKWIEDEKGMQECRVTYDGGITVKVEALNASQGILKEITVEDAEEAYNAGFNCTYCPESDTFIMEKETQQEEK